MDLLPDVDRNELLSHGGTVESLDVRALPSGTKVVVETTNSTYRILVLDGPLGRALLAGGTCFPDETLVRIEGSTCGGSELWMGNVTVGRQLEFLTIDRRERCLTSRIGNIVVEPSRTH